MTRSYDIAEFNLSDGLTPRQVDKLNANFRRLLQILIAEDDSSKGTLTSLDLPLQVSWGGTGSVSFPENSLMIGNGIKPLTYLATKKGFLYADEDGGAAYWRDDDLGDSNWFGNGTPTGTRDPFSGSTGEEKEKHLGDLYFNTSSKAADSTTIYYYTKTGSGSSAAYKWQPVTVRMSGNIDYDDVTDKPTITEADLGIIGTAPNRTFGPVGTSTTVTIEGDNSHADYEMEPFTTTELDVIIAMAEAAGPL